METMAWIRMTFSTPEKPVGTKEMMEFWKSLSEAEKVEYRQLALAAG